jgi:urease accessory protein
MPGTDALLTVSRLLPGGGGLAPVLVARAPFVSLAWDVRQRSRFDATDSEGRRLGVFLPRGSVVRGGDVLVVADGSLVSVRAAPETVLVVRADPQRGSPFDLLRAAYHLGNRHVQLELAPDHLKLEPDHVLAEMLRGMGLAVSQAQAPFEPEAGAYGAHGHGRPQSGGPVHGNAHGHDHAHGHGAHHHEHAGHGHVHDHAGGHAGHRHEQRPPPGGSGRP